MSEWNDLPNAALIDWVIGDIVENQNDWDQAWVDAAHRRDQPAWNAAFRAIKAYQENIEAYREKGRGAAWYAARDAISDATRDAISDAANCSPRRVIRAARNACLALVVYDHAGNLFDMPLEQVRVMAYLGQPAAILMLPACRVREKRREMIHE